MSINIEQIFHHLTNTFGDLNVGYKFLVIFAERLSVELLHFNSNISALKELLNHSVTF